MTTPATSDPRQQSREVPDSHQKALAVNLDRTSFGSFAEIGAGQEVARWFLHVGGASGTVAKTVSAYDKEVSDDLYGAGTRYVSKQRLEAMLASEWKSLSHQVGERRSATTRFFAFANTIAARNFAGTNDCHGWIGLRFQDRPIAEPSDILLHVNLRDDANLLQQEAVGIFGVNLVHALMVGPDRLAAEQLLDRLFDNLSASRIELDHIELSGSAFSGSNVRSLHLSLARDGRAEAVTLSNDGVAVAANELLYKKAVILTPITGDTHGDLSSDAIAACVASLRQEIASTADVKDVIDLRMLTVAEDSSATRAPELLNVSTLITRHEPLYRTSAFIRRYTQAPVRFALSLPALMQIFDSVSYKHLDGRMFEGISRLFGHDIRVVAYPARRDELRHLLNTETGRSWAVTGDGPWITADQIRPASPLSHLYDYLLASEFLVSMLPN